MTKEQFVATFNREPTTVELAWIKCIRSAKVKGILQPICYAYMEVDNECKPYPIPPEWQIAVYGEEVAGCTLAEDNQFTIQWDDVPESDTFIFAISANYNLSSKQPGRSRWTSAEDCEQWRPYFEAIGYSMADVMNVEERNIRLEEGM